MQGNPHLRIAITGGAGLLASNLVRLLQKNYFVLTLFNKTRPVGQQSSMLSVNVGSKQDLSKVLSQYDINCLVHAAALTNVDQCEKCPELAMAVNCDLTKAVSEVCLDLGVKLVFISTDQVFNGIRQKYSEDEDVSPVNIYGMTKSLAEDYLRHRHREALILRTNFFGWGPPHRQSFSDWVITSLRQKQSIKLFNNVYFTPVYISFLIEKIVDLVLADAQGIFHISSDNRLSKWEFGNKLAYLLEADVAFLSRCELKTGDLLALRPTSMSLSNLKFKNFLGLHSVELTDQLTCLLKEETMCIDWMK